MRVNLTQVKDVVAPWASVTQTLVQADKTALLHMRERITHLDESS